MQNNVFCTNYLRFGFLKNSTTIMRSCKVTKTIEYYIINNFSVYLLLFYSEAERHDHENYKLRTINYRYSLYKYKFFSFGLFIDIGKILNKIKFQLTIIL